MASKRRHRWLGVYKTGLSALRVNASCLIAAEQGSWRWQRLHGRRGYGLPAVSLRARPPLGCLAAGMDCIPRTLSRAQTFDVLSSMANIAGYR